MQAARPKLEMELPYRMYRLVNADGTLCERIDKHPFAMSRCALCDLWQSVSSVIPVRVRQHVL